MYMCVAGIKRGTGRFTSAPAGLLISWCFSVMGGIFSPCWKREEATGDEKNKLIGVCKYTLDGCIILNKNR